jgi:hypothetical protein
VNNILIWRAELSSQLTEAVSLVDEAVEQVRNFLSGVSQNESLRRPAPDAWSIGEITHHLVLVLRRAGNLPKIIETQPPDRFNYQAVVANRRFALPDIADPVKGGKGVAPEGVRPGAGGDIKVLSEELSSTWEASKDSVLSVASLDLTRYYYEHFRLGPLNLYEAIAFHGYHAKKHLAQMERTLASIRS